jgi:hypothetical protein
VRLKDEKASMSQTHDGLKGEMWVVRAECGFVGMKCERRRERFGLAFG